MILQKTDPSKGDGLFRRSLVNDLSLATGGRQIQIMQPSDWLGINTASRMRSTDRGLRKVLTWGLPMIGQCKRDSGVQRQLLWRGILGIFGGLIPGGVRIRYRGRFP